MRLALASVLFLVMSIHAFGQKQEMRADQAVVSDTTVFFYAWYKFVDGPYVLTGIDSMKTKKSSYEKDLLKLNETNKIRVLNAGKTKTRNKYVVPSVDAKSDLLEVAPNLQQIRNRLDAFLRQNKGNVVNLDAFKFKKPTESLSRRAVDYK